MTGIVFGGIAPHPPIMVPEIGGGHESEVSASIEAMQRLARELAESRPETAFIISPHGVSHPHAMGVLAAPSSSGSLASWGAFKVKYSFANDLEAVAALEEEAKAVGVALQSIGETSYELDHGVMVPLYFLAKSLVGLPLVPLTFSWLPLSSHFAFGKALGRAAARLNKRVAIIASGDLSHRLLPTAPAGYDPMGAVFDKKLTEAVAAYNTQAILSLDPELIERAGECGLRSIIILLGALEGLPMKSQVLSYEGPFGVGYLVASFTLAAPASQKG